MGEHGLVFSRRLAQRWFTLVDSVQTWQITKKDIHSQVCVCVCLNRFEFNLASSPDAWSGGCFDDSNHFFMKIKFFNCKFSEKCFKDTVFYFYCFYRVHIK